jgi:hypothetical protein
VLPALIFIGPGLRRTHEDVGVIDSWTWSPTTALAAASAALLTPTHRPPPATSIVLPVNGVPLRLPVTRICRRPPRSATSAADVDNGEPAGLVVSPLANACAESHHADQHHMCSDAQQASQRDPVRYETAQ